VPEPNWSRLTPAEQAQVRAEIERIERYYGRLRFWCSAAMMALVAGVWWWRG